MRIMLADDSHNISSLISFENYEKCCKLCRIGALSVKGNNSLPVGANS